MNSFSLNATKNTLLLKVIENLPAGVFAKDVNNDYRFVIWNNEMEKIFNYSSENMLGKNDYDFFDKEEADYYRKIDTDVIEGGKVVDIPLEHVTDLSTLNQTNKFII